MNPRDPLPDDTLSTERAPAPVSYVPTPSAAYRQHRKSAQLLDEPGAPRHGPAPTTRPRHTPYRCRSPSARAC